MLTVLMLGLALLAASGLLVAAGALTGWRRERRRSRRLAEQLLVEGQLEWLTGQTLQAMRHAARQSLRGPLS